MSKVSYRFSAPTRQQSLADVRPSFAADRDFRVHGHFAVTPKPKPSKISFGLLSFSVGAFLLFKVVLVVLLNPEVYQLRVGYLSEGNWVEQLAARLLSIDPVTQLISQTILSVF